MGHIKTITPGKLRVLWDSLTRKQSEKLRQSEEIYRVIFDQAIDSVLITDIDTGEIIDFNRQAHENLGYTREEFARLKISDFDPSFKRERTRMQEFREKSLKHIFLTKNRTKSGDLRDVQVTIQAIHIGGKTMMMNIWHDITEQNKAQVALRESEEKFSHAFNAASDAMVIRSDPGGKFIAVNENYVKLTGYSREELINHSPEDLNMWVKPEDQSNILSTLADKGRSSREVSIRIKSGELRTCLISAEPITVGGQKCFIAVIQDITEQKAAEEALKESEEKFYKVFTTSASAICITRLLDKIIVDVNESYTRFTGYTREEVLGHTGDEFNLWIDEKEKAHYIYLLNKERKFQNFELHSHGKSGEIRVGLASAEIINIGGVPHRIVIIHDITERKQTEAKLTRAEQNFRNSLDSSPLGIRIVTKDGELVYANKAMLDIYGYGSVDELRNTPSKKRFTPESYIEHRERVEKRRRGEAVPTSYEMDIVRKTGEVRHLAVWRKEVLWNNELQYQVIHQDITERKQAEQALQRSEENFRHSLDDLPLGILFVNDKDKVIYANRAMLALYGLNSLEELEAIPIEKRYTPESYAGYLERTEKRQQGNDASSSVEVSIVRTDGQIRHLNSWRKEVLWNGKTQFQIIFQDITERKQAEEALRDSEEKFSKAFLTSANAICIVKAPGGRYGGRYLEVNDSYSRFAGFSREELIGHTGSEIGLLTGEQERQIIMDALKKEGKYRNIEVRRQSKSGEIRVGLASGGELNIGGETCHLMSITDITELKKAEEALRDSEEKFSKAFRATPMAVCITSNKDNRFIEVNESFSRMTGYSLDEIIGHSADDLSLWVGQEEKSKTFSELNTRGKVNYAEFRSRMKSGEIRTLLASAESLTLRGESCRMVVLADITERKKAEEALKTNEENFRHSLDDLPLGIFIVNAEDKVIYANRAMLALYGLNSLEELQAIPLEKRYTPESYAGYLERTEKRQQGNLVRSPIEVSIVRTDGQIRHLNAWRKEVLWNDKTQYQVIFQDITERKKAEEALRDSEEKFFKAFNASPDCMAITRLDDGRYIEVNDSLVHFTGYSREYILSKSFNKIQKWDVSKSHNLIMEKLETSGRVVKEECNFRTKSGEIKTMWYSAETLKIHGVDCVLSITTDITERKQMEEALRDSEEKFSKAFQSTPNAICITSNKDNRFIEANESFSRFCGYSHDEIIGHTASDLDLWVDEDERLKFFGELFEKGRVYNTEFRSRMKSGEIRIILASAENLTIRGEPCRMLVLADITERKMAELALADSEKKLRIMFDSVISGIAVADLNGKITGVNRRILEMHGFADDSEVIGENAVDLVVPQERERAAVNITNNLKERKSAGLEYTLLRKDGSTFLGEISVSLLNDASGAPIGYIAVSRDITQRKQTELALKESEVKYSTLVENSNDGIIIIQDAKVKFANSIMNKLSGYNSQECLDRPFFDFIPPQYHPKVAGYYEQRTMNQLPNAHEAKMLTKDNRSIPVEISISLIKYNGLPAEMAVIHDITERKQAETQLQEAYRKETEMRQELEVEMKRRAEFTRALVHELKTPLTPILASSEGLLDLLETEPAKGLAANINRGGHNLNKRIDELLDVARSELNILKITPKLIDLRPIFEEVGAEMSVVAKKKAQVLNLEIPRVLSKVNADYNRIKQVVDNLVTNAVKYTQNGGTITIGARESDGKLIVEVRDNGAGLTKEDLNNIFDPYYRKEVKGDNLSGLGLGLSLCKKFVELHGGEIWAASTPGKGSSFSFSLPVIHRK